MTDRLRSVSPQLRVAIVTACALLLTPASTASADDIYEIDGRLQDAGLDLAYTEAFGAVDRPGVRILVDFDSSSQDEAAYQREVEQAAELVWAHLEGPVLAIDVAPTFDVPWAENGLPSAVSFDRAALVERFGARPPGLDGADVETVDEGGVAFVGALVAGWLLSVVAVGAGAFVLARARYRRAWAAVGAGHWGGWTGPATVPGAPPQPAGWPQPAAWPPPATVPGQWPPAPTAPPHGQAADGPVPQASPDPWRPLG